jgi:hypothetical protein
MDWLFNRVPPGTIIDDVASKFGPDVTRRLTNKICNNRQGFYMNVIKLMLPAVLTWMTVQIIAAIAGEHTSRWVGILAIALAFLAFAVSWYYVVDVVWKRACPK